MDWNYPLNLLREIVRVAIEIGILTVLIYLILAFLRGTRGAMVLAGVTVLGLALNILAQAAGLQVIEWLISQMWAIFAIAVLVIFQPEIRRALAEIGRRRGFIFGERRRREEIVEVLLDSAYSLAARRIGAIIAVEREIGMRGIAETGILVDGALSRELLMTIFWPGSPLHDGGVIIRHGRIRAAGCVFPLAQEIALSDRFGMRHRAGVGLSQETDAIVLIVSEERGAVSLAYRGRLLASVERDRLARHLNNYLVKRAPRTWAERVADVEKRLHLRSPRNEVAQEEAGV